MNNKEWKMFDRCYSGMLKYDLKNKHLREKKQFVHFATFTTNPVSIDGCKDSEKLEVIQRNFRALKKRYKDEFGKDIGEYFSVRTFGVKNPDLVHMHVLYVGDDISHSWLVENWNELHGSHIVDIRVPKGGAYKGAMYVIGQYVASQEGKSIFGYSRNWVYGGFAKDLDYLKNSCKIWDDHRSYLTDSGYEVWYYPVDLSKFYERLKTFIFKRCIRNEVVPYWSVT